MKAINKLRTAEIVEILNAKKATIQNSSRAMNGLAGNALEGTCCFVESKRCPNRCKTGGRMEFPYLSTSTSIRDDFSNLENAIEQSHPPTTCSKCNEDFIIKIELRNHIVIDVSMQCLFSYSLLLVTRSKKYTQCDNAIKIQTHSRSILNLLQSDISSRIYPKRSYSTI